MAEPTFVTDLLAEPARQTPTRTAIVDKTGEYTYGALNALAEQVAGWLQDVGIGPGDRVLLFGTNGSRLVAALFGILKVGAIFVPIHPATSGAKLAFLVQNCAPAAFVIDPQLLQAHINVFRSVCRPVLLTSDTVPDSQGVTPQVSTWTMLMQYRIQQQTQHSSSNSLAAIIYTSGSTKNPRGVMLPHRQVVFATTAINAVLGNTAEDVILCGLPLSFDYGLYQVFLAFQVGAKLILERDFSLPMVIPRLIEDHRVTGFPGVPSVFGMLLRSRLLERTHLTSLRYITSTGDVLPTAYIGQLQKLLPNVTVYPMYGLTECKRVSIMPRGQLAGHESSVGKPLPGTNVSVVDEAGNRVAAGITGELVVNGPHVMAGYWNDPRETAKKFRFDQQSGQTLLYTGDYFRMDGDGFLYFVGRSELFIKSRGHKISPLEIEASIYGLDGVAEVAVVGVPDPILGESIHAFVALKNPTSVKISQIDEHCRNSLSPVLRPTCITIVDILPKTENGKVDRLALQARARQ